MRRRRGLWLGLVLGLALAAHVSWTEAGRQLIVRRVVCTATTNHVVASADTRQTLTLLNTGTINVYVGGETGSVVQTLHVGSTIEFEDARAGVRCNTVGEYAGTGSTTLDVTEEFR